MSMSASALPLAVGRSAIQFARSLAAGGNFTPSDGGWGACRHTNPPTVGKNSKHFLGILIKYLLRMVDIIVY